MEARMLEKWGRESGCEGRKVGGKEPRGRKRGKEGVKEEKQEIKKME